MPKFRRELASLQEPLDFWLYFFQNGKELDADVLPDPLARPEICQAMEVLKVFSQSELERDRYENRLKASRDQQAMMEERDEAIQERQQAEEKLRQAERLAKQNVSAPDPALPACAGPSTNAQRPTAGPVDRRTVFVGRSVGTATTRSVGDLPILDFWEGKWGVVHFPLQAEQGEAVRGQLYFQGCFRRDPQELQNGLFDHQRVAVAMFGQRLDHGGTRTAISATLQCRSFGDDLKGKFS